MGNRWELEYHTTLMSLIRVVKNLRSRDCEHCEYVLKEVYKCMDGETKDIRDRANDDNEQ